MGLRGVRWIEVGLLLLLGGCCLETFSGDAGSTTTYLPQPTDPAAPWPAAYSLVYARGVSEPGLGIRYVFGADAGGEVCAVLSSTAYPVTLWEVMIGVPAGTGIFPIRQWDGGSPLDGGGLEAEVSFEHSGQHSFQFAAMSGTVTVTQAPSSIADQSAGEHLTGSLHLVLPSLPYGSYCPIPADYSYPYDCDCLDPDGNIVFTCNAGPGCCSQREIPSATLDATFDATSCSRICDLGDFDPRCELLLEDGGAGG